MTAHTNPLRRAAHCLLVSATLIALLGAGEPATRFKALGHQLMCICGCGQILLECNHVGCPDSDGMRNELMAAVSRGDSDSLVEQSFVQKYGPTVLAAPTTSGFDRTAWIMPIVAFFAGFAVLILIVRGWRNGPPPPPSGNGGIGPSGSGGRGPKISRDEFNQYRDQAEQETDL